MPELIKIDEITPQEIASICDHTFLHRSEQYKKQAEQTGQSAVALRKKAFQEFLTNTIQHSLQPYAICVRPEDVTFTREEFGKRLKGIRIASVVGFPDGSHYPTELKVAETRFVAPIIDEVDMVLDYESLKKGLYDIVQSDVKAVVSEAHEHGALVKLILETSELNPKQIIEACTIAEKCEIDFVKTSTGFSAYGARAEAVKLIRDFFPRGIKISGGVNKSNVHQLLIAASGRIDGFLYLDPTRVRIGETKLLDELAYETG